MISYKGIAIQILSYSSKADYNCYWVIANLCFKFRCHSNRKGSGVKLNDTVQFAIFEYHILKPKITTLSYTQWKLWPFKELFDFPIAAIVIFSIFANKYVKY